MNSRLGLLGGISILGTTGVVRPFSTAAWQASVAAAIDVARAQALDALVLTTGGRTEAYAMRLRPGTPEVAFIQVGDAVGAALRHAARRGIARVELVAMVGKMSKLAAGALQITRRARRWTSGSLRRSPRSSVRPRRSGPRWPPRTPPATRSRRGGGRDRDGGRGRALPARRRALRCARAPRGADGARRVRWGGARARRSGGGAMSERIVAAGRRIEEESLAIIDREAGAHGFGPRA